MLISSKQMLQKAHQKGYAIGAFNINNMEILQAIIMAAVAEKSPVIIQTSEGAIEYAGVDYLHAMVKVAARAKIPIAFHLDHGKNFKFVKQMIKTGLHTSIMYDGSSLPYVQNVRKTKDIVRLAHKKRMQVEAELGAIAGIEDFVSVKDKDAHLTNPERATEFVKTTRCDSLAVAIGTAHGAFKFKGASRLDIGRLKKIKSMVNVPLVLHGASGVPLWLKRRCINLGCKIEKAHGVSDANLKSAIRAGINKINVDTDLRLAMTVGVRQSLKDHPDNIDPRKYLGPARDLMTKVVKDRMRLFGCSGKA